jgi:hypothetical protein
VAEQLPGGIEEAEEVRAALVDLYGGPPAARAFRQMFDQVSRAVDAGIDGEQIALHLGRLAMYEADKAKALADMNSAFSQWFFSPAGTSANDELLRSADLESLIAETLRNRR